VEFKYQSLSRRSFVGLTAQISVVKYANEKLTRQTWAIDYISNIHTFRMKTRHNATIKSPLGMRDEV